MDGCRVQKTVARAVLGLGRNRGRVVSRLAAFGCKFNRKTFLKARCGLARQTSHFSPTRNRAASPTTSLR